MGVGGAQDVFGVCSGVWQEGATSSDTPLPSEATLPSWGGAPVHLGVALALDTWLASWRLLSRNGGESCSGGKNPLPANPNRGWSLGDECGVFLRVWGYCGNEYIPSQPSRVFCYPVFAGGLGQVLDCPFLRGALRRTLGSWQSACSPSVLTVPCLGLGSSGGGGAQ